MPLSGTEGVLGPKIAATVKAQAIDPTSPVSDQALEDLWTAVAKDIIDHIVANTVVNTTTTTTGVTGTGPAGGPLPIAAQPGVGVGTVS